MPAVNSSLLKKIQTYDFMLFELNLYLDTHPNCQNALEMHRRYTEMLNAATDEYQRRFGPLTARAAGSGETWRWVDSPWPWEREAN